MKEKKIRMMTKLADFEQNNRKELETAATYYRSDYIGIQLLKNLLRITAAYLVGAGLWACYHLDDLIRKLNAMDIRGLLTGLLVSYGGVLLFFLLLTYAIHTVRFYRAERKLLTYRNMLERLVLEYGREEPGQKRRSADRQRDRKQGGTDYDDIVEL